MTGKSSARRSSGDKGTHLRSDSPRPRTGDSANWLTASGKARPWLVTATSVWPKSATVNKAGGSVSGASRSNTPMPPRR